MESKFSPASAAGWNSEFISLSVTILRTCVVCVCVCVCVTTENDIHTIVGLNCSSIPVSIAWEMALSSSAANVERQETSNSNYSRLVVLILHLS